MWPVWLGAVAVLLVWLWRIWGEHYLQMRRYLSKFPGPKPLPLIGNILDIGFDLAEIFNKAREIWRKHGSVLLLWLGPEPLVILSDPRDVEVILSDTKNLDKGFPYRFVEPWLGKGLLTSTGEKWHKHRKILTPTFHFKILEQFAEVFSRQGDVLIRNLQEKENKGSFDVCPYIDLYTQDVICETAMGVNIGAQQRDEGSSDYVTAVKRQTEYITERCTRPWLFPDFLFEISPSGKKQRKNLEILHKATTEVIKERKELLEKDPTKFEEGFDDSGMKKRFAFLDLLLLAAAREQALSDEEIREEVDTFMFEGHDTTSRGISFALYELSKRPDIQERIFKELKDVIGESSDLALPLDKFNELKYLECVIKEVLRLYPSVPAFTRKLKNNIDLKTRALTVPSGCTVAVAPYGVHRQADAFPDPEAFDPERFAPDRARGRHAYAYIPFSAGPRNCIGQKFAMLEMKSAIAKIVWKYRLLPDPTFEPHIIVSITLTTSNGIKLKVAPRISN